MEREREEKKEKALRPSLSLLLRGRWEGLVGVGLPFCLHESVKCPMLIPPIW